MKLIIFKKEGFAINIDRIDGICRDNHNSEFTRIFTGGAYEPFVVNKPFEEVVTIIYDEIHKAEGNDNE